MLPATGVSSSVVQRCWTLLLIFDNSASVVQRQLHGCVHPRLSTYHTALCDESCCLWTCGPDAQSFLSRASAESWNMFASRWPLQKSMKFSTERYRPDVLRYFLSCCFSRESQALVKRGQNAFIGHVIKGVGFQNDSSCLWSMFAAVWRFQILGTAQVIYHPCAVMKSIPSFYCVSHKLNRVSLRCWLSCRKQRGGTRLPLFCYYFLRVGYLLTRPIVGTHLEGLVSKQRREHKQNQWETCCSAVRWPKASFHQRGILTWFGPRAESGRLCHSEEMSR